MKAGSDWATAGVADASVADPASPGRVVIDGAALPRVLGGTGHDAVPVQVAARSVGMLKDLPVPEVVGEAWGASSVVAAVAEEEEEEGEASSASASASSSTAAPTASAEGKATERPGVVSLTATAAL